MKGFILYIIAVLFTLSTSAQSHSLPSEVDRLTLSEDGLTNNAITTLLLDSKGYLWVGTYDGLFKYNGIKLSAIDFDGGSLLDRRIRSLGEDYNGNILIGSDIGISRFNRYLDRIERITLPELDPDLCNNFSIISILRNADQDKIYAIAENYGVIIYDKSGELSGVAKLPIKCTILYSTLDQKGRLLIATTNGLMIYDPATSDKITLVESDLKENIIAMTQIGDNGLIVAPRLGGIFECEIESKNDKYTLFLRSKRLYANYRVKAVSFDKDGALWLGTFIDGVRYIPNYTTGERKEYHLARENRISLFLNQGDYVWIGTYSNGATRFSLRNKIFTNVGEVIKEEDLQMSKLTPWRNGEMMIHTLSNKTYIYDYKNDKTTQIPDCIKSLPELAFRYYLTTPDSTQWVITGRNVWYRIRGKELVKVRNNVILSLKDQVPICAISDRNGDIWLGYKNNLYHVKIDVRGYPTKIESIKDHELFNDQEAPRIRIVYPDPKEDGVIWAGTTTNGLFKIEYNTSLKDSKISNYEHSPKDDNSISSNFISAILRDNNGDLWIGTEQGGVCRMVTSPESEEVSFERFTTKNGLSNNIVKSIVEDKSGDIWIATNYGLNRLEKENGSIYTYHRTEALPFEQFWYGAELLNTGELLFSCIKGVMKFDPKDLTISKSKPNLEFSDLRLLNRKIKPQEMVNNRVIIDSSLHDRSTIKLKHNENIIQIGVDVIDKSTMRNSHIQYQILPLSKEWLSRPSSEGSITLNGLEAGKYTINVAAIDAFGQRSTEKSLRLEIAAHPLQSTLAIIIYIVLIIVIMCLIVFVALHISSLRHSLVVERIKKSNAEKLSNEKQRFYMNISHELKTPLTLILAPANALAQRFKFDVDIISKVEVIRRQSNRMIQLIDSTHKLNLDEMNILEPQLANLNFDAFMTEILDDFKFLAENENKELIVNATPSIYINADKSLLEMAINNVLNNAFKYTRAEERISVSYHVENNIVELTVTDSGAGISKDDLPHIFEPYFRGADAKRQRLGSGIGLSFTKRLIEIHKGKIEAHSEMGMGTSFTIKLPAIEVDSANYNNKSLSERDHSIILDPENNSIPEIPQEIKGSIVYVVEDNVEMRDMIVDALQADFSVKSFESGEECLEHMSKEWPHIIISDVMMGGMSGFELCREIKGSLSTSHIPVILLTGLSSVDDKIKGLEAGADAYIYKPFYINHLLTRITHLLKGRNRLRERFESGIPTELKSLSGSISQLDSEFIESLYKLFDENLENEQVDMDYVARELLLSRATLYQKIKTMMGSTPYELLKSYRLRRAAELLQSGEANVNEVCMMTGFKNRTHFSRIFKENYGVSPSKYIKK